MRRAKPRQAAGALRRLVEDAAPETALAAVQGAWPRAAGETVARQAEPVSERAGVVTIACHTAAWAQELDLLQVQLLKRLNEELGSERISGLRFTADGSRHRL